MHAHNHFITSSLLVLSNHDPIEFLASYLLSIFDRSLQHLLQLLRTHCFSKLLGDTCQICQVYRVRVVIVEEIEYLVNALLS